MVAHIVKWLALSLHEFVPDQANIPTAHAQASFRSWGGQGRVPSRQSGHSSPAPGRQQLVPLGMTEHANECIRGCKPSLACPVNLRSCSLDTAQLLMDLLIPASLWGREVCSAPGSEGQNRPMGTLKGQCGSREAYRSHSPLVSQPPAPATLFEAPWAGEDEPGKEMCPRPDADAELLGTTQCEMWPPPLSSAVEMKPSLMRLGGLKHVLGKSGPENMVRLALNLTLTDLQELRQRPGSSTPCALI